MLPGSAAALGRRTGALSTIRAVLSNERAGLADTPPRADTRMPVQ
jgi:hypothetical protein